MYGDSEDDLREYLFNTQRHWMDKLKGNRVAAEEKVAETVAQDGRFTKRNLDPGRVAQRVDKCIYRGAQLNLKDPDLQKGGNKSPGSGMISSNMRPRGW